MLSRLLPASRTRVLCVQHPTTAARPAPGGQVFILSISGIPRNTSFLPFRAISCNFASLRRSRKGLLHGPSRPFVDKKGVLSGPSWPFVDKKGVLSGPSWPFVDQEKVFFMALRDPPWTKKVFLVVLRGPSWTKKVFSVVLRGPPWTKKVFFVVLRGPSWTKKVFSVVLRGPSRTKKGVLSGPSRPSVDKKGVLRGPSWPSVDKNGVLRGPSWPFVDKKGVLCGPPWPSVDKIRFSPRPFADRPNYNLANLSSDHRHRALVQRLPFPLDPCNRSYNARTSTHDFPAPLPHPENPQKILKILLHTTKTAHFSNARFCCMIPVIPWSTARATNCRMS